MIIYDIIRRMMGWRKATRKDMVVWYKPPRKYEGYPVYNCSKALDTAFEAIKANKKKFRGKAKVTFTSHFSTGRIGLGVRKVSYRITP